jgi:tRNA G18 (ribose-2'-O)-methylase SpoU
MATQNRKLRTLEMKRLTAEEYREAEKTPLVVVLDDVRSMYNVGSVFRTADAFRLKEVCLCGITGQPPNNEIHKTALGAEDSVAWRYFPTASEAVDCLHNEGYKVFAVEQCEGSFKLHKEIPCLSEKNIAVVLGNEVKGVHQEVIDQCDGCLEIRQYGTKHSMNVAVTAGIVIWEIFMRIKR